MRALHRDLRNELERVVIEARDVAERAAEAALARLAVGEASPYGEMTPAQRELRVELRARGRALGDERDPKSGRQETRHLVREMAYQHWHRMLFARFLAENDLLIHPEGVPVTLGECEELARAEGAANGWALAEHYAARMLPQIFRPDDPVLQVPLAPEHQQALERLLSQLPPEVFRADDSLGWTYQFWQSKRKDEVNASGEKIGADELPAVTQLFTEDYMVQFLLDNTLGAWWAGKYLAEHPEVADDLSLSEEELRRRVAPEGCSFEYLRFIKVEAASSRLDTRQDAASTIWRPAAGTFDGWPKEAKDLKVMDPCCGSGHFLVAALHKLVPMRMEEEGLSAREACDAVLAENLYGLEIDPRCTQIAAFALALAAWTYPGAGEYRELPELNIACSGIPVRANREEWLELAGDDSRLRDGMEQLYELFQDAPTLGSLINPARAQGDVLTAGITELRELLAEALTRESELDASEKVELGVSAQGIVKAAELLGRTYVTVVTNPPFLLQRKQDALLKRLCEQRFPETRKDLATCMLERMKQFSRRKGTTACVFPQNWTFMPRDADQRISWLQNASFRLMARLGPGAFDTISGEVVKVCLFVIDYEAPSLRTAIFVADAMGKPGAEAKARFLEAGEIRSINQLQQLENPDSRIILEGAEDPDRLADYVETYKGLCTGDLPRFVTCFWETASCGDSWRPYRGSTPRTSAFAGVSETLLWEDGTGQLIGFVKDRLGENIAAWIRGTDAWGQEGIAVNRTGSPMAALYGGEIFDQNVAVLIPKEYHYLAPLWCFCSSAEFEDALRRIDQNLHVTDTTISKVGFRFSDWQTVAREKCPDGLPSRHSVHPTEWAFGGAIPPSARPLQTAVAQMLGFRWPQQTREPDDVEKVVDKDGICGLPALTGEDEAGERLRQMLAAAYGEEWSPAKETELLAAAHCEGKSLETWLRDYFFEQHCRLFHNRPFIWHIWDGVRSGGFSALVNYHRLDRRLLERLTYTYLGDWIRRQEDEVKRGAAGAEGRLVAARALQGELKKIIEGEPPYDIFVRWKPIEEQPIGWEPDLNDGVRMNIRPFMMAKDVGRKGAGILRYKPNIKWTKDRGKEPERPQEQYPWFWEKGEFTGNRVNDVHLTPAEKRAARERAKDNDD